MNHETVANSLVEAVRAQAANDNPLDFVIITGDIAYSGKQEEYKVAKAFCQSLLEAVDLPLDRLYLVPGNHDVDRGEIKPVHLKWYHVNKQDDISEVLNDPETFSTLMRKFAAFNDFVEQTTGTRYFDESTYHFVRTLTLIKNERSFQINLAGLNSALFAGYDDDDKQKLAVSLRQVQFAMADRDNNAILSIGFFHHPFTALHPAEDVCKSILKHELDLILTGHLHQPENAFTYDSAGKHVSIAAGAAYETRESCNSFNLTEINLNSGQGQVQFYKYIASKDRWVKDVEINPDHPDGIFFFEVNKLSHPTKTANIGKYPSNPVNVLEMAKTDPNCVCYLQRYELIDGLKRYLESYRYIVVNGQPMVGKTEFIYEVAKMLNNRYVPLIISMQSIDIDNIGDFLFDLINQIIIEFKNWVERNEDRIPSERIRFLLNDPDKNEFEMPNGKKAFDKYWDELLCVLGDNNSLLIIIDEVEHILGYPEELGKQVIDFIDKYVSNQNNGSFILVGSERIQSSQNILFNKLIQKREEIFEIPYYKEETVSVLLDTIRNYLTDEHGILQRLAALSDGHPRILKTMFNIILLKATDNKSLKEIDFERILVILIRKTSYLLWQLGERLSEDERFMIWLISQKQPSAYISEFEYSLNELIGLAKEQFPERVDKLEKGLNSLIEKEWAERKNGNDFRFKLGIFPVYVQRRYVSWDEVIKWENR